MTRKEKRKRFLTYVSFFVFGARVYLIFLVTYFILVLMVLAT